MLTFNYKKRFINMTERIGHLDHSLKLADTKADILLEMELLLSMEEIDNFKRKKKCVYLVLPNYLIDLKETEQGIFSNMHKSTKYEINRAMNRDELEFVELCSPTNEQIEHFSHLYNSFAKELNIRKIELKRLQAIRDCGGLVISYIKKGGQILCYTAYLTDGNQAYGIYSGSSRFTKEDSIDRNIVGRANRYLHWKNIQSCKQRGCNWYNFGAQFTDPNDKQGQNINKFKLSFGPKIGYEAKRFSSKTALGKLILILLNIKWKKNNEYTLYEKKDTGFVQNN